jgi:MFS family permease
METRALAIAFFFAVGTAIGGITGPLLFGQMIESGDRGLVAMSFLIGAAVMAIGGVVEVVLGVKAEGRPLEDLALPLTADQQPEEAEPTGPPDDSEREVRIAARTERPGDRPRPRDRDDRASTPRGSGGAPQ